MKHSFYHICLLVLALAAGSSTQAQQVNKLAVTDISRVAQKAPTQGKERAAMEIHGTGASETFVLSTTALIADVEVTATAGLAVSPTRVPMGSKDVTITVTNTTTIRKHSGKVILRSADEREYVDVITYGTELEQRDLSQNPVYAGGSDSNKTFSGFTPGSNGYTVEFKAKVDDTAKHFFPFAVTDQGVGFKGYVSSDGIGLYNAETKKGLSNPSNGGTFYNTDGLYHTYRYAVTSDKRVIIYRDGILIDTLRTQDLALPADFYTGNGEVKENLIKNGDFEGEYDFSKSRNIVTYIEGWDVYPWDQYNSTQDIVTEERSNEVDQNDHVVSIDRYMWSDGWAAAEISQVIGVAPNEIYSLSALAKGGMKSDGTKLGSLRIQDMQNSDNKAVISVTSDSWQTYAQDFETKDNTKEIRVTLYLERDKWGASVSPLRVDNVKMTGVSREVSPTVGFTNDAADLAYFTYDTTGAYAPLTSEITTSADSVVIRGTNAFQVITVDGKNLISDIKVSATNGLLVWPQTIKAGSGATQIRITNLTTRKQAVGKVILRSADQRKYVKVVTYGTELERRDLSQNPVYAGEFVSHKEFTDFTPGENGFTVEFKARVDDVDKGIYPYAVTQQGVGFKGYVENQGVGIFNSSSKHGLSNPSNGGTFYNTDGLYHTYRYAVTSDKRVIIYRDGILIDTLRTQDFALQPEWYVAEGKASRNLIKNGDFEGEWDFSKSRNITNYIEGFQVNPWDQYNSYQDIVHEERSNEVDQENCVLSMNRYKWEDGYSAGEVSQIVNVSPGQIYTLSALAKGGIKSDGTKLGSLRIQDMQNSDNKTVLTIDSDNWKTYSTDFETKGNTREIRVSCYIERDKWGATISALKVDDLKLAGYSRTLISAIGFDNSAADLAYFTYDTTGAYAPPVIEIATSADSLEINGTGASQSFVVNTQNLISDVSLTATHGFSVTPSVIKAGVANTTVTVTNLTTLRKNAGKIILRSADLRKSVYVKSYGTELEQRDLSQNPVYTGNEAGKTFVDFEPGDNGYTVEFKAKVDDTGKDVYPFAVTDQGVGFKGYVSSDGIGLYNSETKKGLSNPSNGGTFYNTDGLYHTYRYAVTSDKRVIIYRDGILIDTLRTQDLALPADFYTGNGDVKENLIKNGDFEGEYNYSESRGIVTHIEGWDVSPWDQWNSTQDIVTEERSNLIDQSNHVLSVNRYKWEAGWAAAEISQIIGVAPNELYSLSALVKGGIKSNGTQLGSLRIQDMQNSDNKAVIPITSDSWQTYAQDFETKDNTKEIRVTFYLERDAWGASISALRADDVKLTGVSRTVAPKVGFIGDAADLAYFTYDTTGAYAPPVIEIATSADSLEINGTGASQSFVVNTQNLISDVSLTATHGFSVTPSVIKAGAANTTVTVTNLTTLRKNAGKIILRSADLRKSVYVKSYGTELEQRDLSQNPVYTGNEAGKTFMDFEPGDNGYTVEFKAKVDDTGKDVYPFAVTDQGVGFKGYVSSDGIGLYNSETKKGLSNPSNGGTFYNTDGLYHTYRYAVTSDKRVIIYRDGILIDTLRTQDLALPADFYTGNGDVKENLIKNGDFEGEYNYSESRGIVTHIEGWDVSPWDQWNSTQDIVTEERSNLIDQSNHVLSVNRYKWEAGWAAAEISQIIGVAPNELYSLSALVKGGIKSNGTQLGSLRIQDMQNSDNKAVIPITSDSWQTYAQDFETKDNTKEIRVTFYLERDAWGASISALRADDVKLTGVSRTVAPKVGFIGDAADLAYFTYDTTGAYAPLIADMTAHDITDATGLTDKKPDRHPLQWRTDGDRLRLTNLPDAAVITLYDMRGRKLKEVKASGWSATVPLPSRGVFICTVRDRNEKQVIKVRY